MSSDLAPAIQTHLQDFHNWLDLADRSKDNYTRCVRTFYRRTGRDTPIKPGEYTDKQAELLVDDLTQHITSQSMKFALQKYLDWYSQRATAINEERNITFFKNKVARMDPDVNHQDVKEKVLSVDKVAELCRATPELMNTDQKETQLLLQMMYDTATRISGMTRLEWRDVFRTEFSGEQLADNELVISSDRSKSKESGVVELTDDTLRRLNQHRQQVTPTDTHEKVFFPAIQRDSAYDKIYSPFKDAAEQIGVPDASPHWFRHSRLTHLGLQMLEDGHSYPEIKERLRAYGRHRNGETTEIYIKILKNRKQERISQYSTVEWS